MADSGVLRLMRIALCLALLATSATADDRSAFYGSWGTAEQCSGTPIKPGGTVMATPIEIDDTFLRQGQIWCRLSWGSVEQRPAGPATTALAQCGEDNVRIYQIGLGSTGASLTIRWDFPLTNGPLGRCDVGLSGDG